ncbi:YceH family protein [Deefgea salmonis]|uniref:YceH family protein n=1 Tax=Deefgea salmonis TaxID=2875502 RepID=A0ABS8BLT5_9NEIS|nr:YceH family protein [Deefgea salmonis]MCB5196670.1 YceH family protein [Deefgea salmonis]
MIEVNKLSQLEVRILGALIEKQHTVPDSYPLTLNALLAACNQKSSRDPVIDATEGELLVALDHLREQGWVLEVNKGRVLRYEQALAKVLRIPSQSVALLAVLMLRGPQTSGELRLNCERLHRFADISAVEGFLEELAARQPAALVLQISKQAGARECRWCHLLAGEPPVSSVEMPQLDLVARVAYLEQEVEKLKATMAAVLEK